MRRGRWLIAVELAVSAAALWVLSLGLAHLSGWRVGVAFLVAQVVLRSFDVWLPRGDSADLTGPAVFAAGALCEPWVAAATVVITSAFVGMARRRPDSLWPTIASTSRRLVALSASALALRQVAPVHGGAYAADRWEVLLALSIAATVFVSVDFILEQLRASWRMHTRLGSLLTGNLRLQGWMSAAQVSAAVLAVLLYEAMTGWGLGIVVALLLVMRQSFSLYMEVKAAYQSTIAALARAIEVQNPDRRGHAERVSQLSSMAGREFGLHGRTLEALTNAALFHDVGRLGMRAGETNGNGGSASVLSAVRCLADAVPILEIVDRAGDSVESQAEENLVCAYIVCRMSEFDDLRTTPVPPGLDCVSDLIGSRLYRGTRNGIDRVIKRVQARFIRAAVRESAVLRVEPT